MYLCSRSHSSSPVCLCPHVSEMFDFLLIIYVLMYCSCHKSACSGLLLVFFLLYVYFSVMCYQKGCREEGCLSPCTKQVFGLINKQVMRHVRAPPVQPPFESWVYLKTVGGFIVSFLLLLFTMSFENG